MVEDVIKPNKWEYHNRFNPMCDQPEIILKNTGEQTLENATIIGFVVVPMSNIHGMAAYLLMSLKMWCYQYLINLLDQQFCKRFHVAITQVNGTTDEYEKNNYYSTTFETLCPNEISLWLELMVQDMKQDFLLRM